jgi:hypothetical protein
MYREENIEKFPACPGIKRKGSELNKINKKIDKKCLESKLFMRFIFRYIKYEAITNTSPAIITITR